MESCSVTKKHGVAKIRRKKRRKLGRLAIKNAVASCIVILKEFRLQVKVKYSADK